jgi:hypothetical protein
MKTSVSQAKNNQLLMDWATGMGQMPPSDKRVQLKIPSQVLKKLDELYPDVDRSRVITQLVLQAIVMKLKFLDRPDLGELVESEQSELDEMWNYLEKRDAGI